MLEERADSLRNARPAALAGCLVGGFGGMPVYFSGGIALKKFVL